MNFRTPNSLDRFSRKLALREGMEFTPGLAVHCQLFDFGLGGGGTSANQTTQTTSGQGRGVAGNRNQYVESGAIAVGNGRYQESGSIGSASNSFNTPTGLAGANVNLGKGATLNFTAAPSPQPISSLTAAPGTVPIPTSPLPSPAPAPADPSLSTPSTSSLWQSIKDHWAAWSTWQKVGAGIAGALIVWLIFSRRRA